MSTSMHQTELPNYACLPQLSVAHKTLTTSNLNSFACCQSTAGKTLYCTNNQALRCNTSCPVSSCLVSSRPTTSHHISTHPVRSRLTALKKNDGPSSDETFPQLGVETHIHTEAPHFLTTLAPEKGRGPRSGKDRQKVWGFCI